MKRLILVTAVISILALGGATARAADTADTYDDSIMHPLRIAYYLVHPVGFAAEWLIGRPFHYIISRPYLDRVFGYSPHQNENVTSVYRRQM